MVSARESVLRKRKRSLLSGHANIFARKEVFSLPNIQSKIFHIEKALFGLERVQYV
jgi:hypothetical protein